MSTVINMVVAINKSLGHSHLVTEEVKSQNINLVTHLWEDSVAPQMPTGPVWSSQLANTLQKVDEIHALM